jgi:hypothetical protein
MQIPMVTELAQTQEAVSRDPFLDDDAAVARPPAPVRRAATAPATRTRS